MKFTVRHLDDVPKVQNLGNFSDFILPRSNCSQPARSEHFTSRTFGCEMLQNEADLKTRKYFGDDTP